jgi:hypothetical protein
MVGEHCRTAARITARVDEIDTLGIDTDGFTKAYLVVDDAGGITVARVSVWAFGQAAAGTGAPELIAARARHAAG